MEPMAWGQGAWLLLGLGVAGQSLLAWALMHGRGDTRAVRLWAAGGLSLGLGLALAAAHTALPQALGLYGAWALCLAAPLLRLAALHRPRPAADAGITVWGAGNSLSPGSVLENPASEPPAAHLAARPAPMPAAPPRPVPAVALGLLLLMPLGLALWLGDSRWQAPALVAGWAMAQLALASDCARVWRKRHYRSAGLLALGEALLAATLLLLCAAQLLASTPGHWLPGTPGSLWPHGGLAAACLGGVVLLCCTLSNLGGLGFTMDHLRRSRQRLQRQLAAAQADGAALVANAPLWQHALAERSQALAQRDALAEEHAKLLHWVRSVVQPDLGGAEQALQTTRHMLDILPPPEAAALRPSLDQAELTLYRLRDSTANTLAAASLPGQMTPAESTDLAGLLLRTVQDLPSPWRHRVVFEGLDEAGQATVVPEGVRLALRSLLRNAFEHGHATAPVRLQVHGSADGQMVQLSVCDRGPGLPTEAGAAHPVATPDAGPPKPMPHQGLGLQTARRVAALHQGELAVRALQPFGLQVSLRLPRQTTARASPAQALTPSQAAAPQAQAPAASLGPAGADLADTLDGAAKPEPSLDLHREPDVQTEQPAEPAEPAALLRPQPWPLLAAAGAASGWPRVSPEAATDTPPAAEPSTPTLAPHMRAA